MARDDNTAPSVSSGRIDLLILAGLSLGLFSYHILVSTLSSYGYFIDEFYRPQRRAPNFVARGPKFSITKEWGKLKIYD